MNKINISARNLGLIDVAVSQAPYEWKTLADNFTITGEVQPSADAVTGWDFNVPPRLRSSLLLQGSVMSKLSAGRVKH